MSSKSERDLCRRSIFPCTCEKGKRVGETELLVRREMKREGRKHKRCKKARCGKRVQTNDKM